MKCKLPSNNRPGGELFECDNCDPLCQKIQCSKLIGVKRIVPGTPEFDELVKSITPIDKIRHKECPFELKILDERAPFSRKRYRHDKDPDKL